MVKRAQYEGANMVTIEKAKEALERLYISGNMQLSYVISKRHSEDFDTVCSFLEVLKVIYNSPFIIDNLVELGKLPPEAKKRYLFGTITNAEVEKVEEFFKNGEK